MVAKEKTAVSLTYKPTTKPKTMYILIATANEQLIQSLYPSKKIEFHKQDDSSGRFHNTSVFKMTKPQFSKLYKAAKDKGFNPYALLTW